MELLGFFFFIHLVFDGVADKTVQTFALAGGKVLDDLPLAFLDDNIDTVIGLFVVSCGRFLLGVIILRMVHKITSKLY